MQYKSLSETLRELGFMQDAAEYHGILSGMLCWSDSVPIDLGLNEEAGGQSAGLGEMQQSLHASLEDASMGFEIMLPEDSQPLATRANALGQWCAGYLHGLATREGFKPEQASEAVQEAIEDLSAISRAGSMESGDEQEEAAYTELVEFVRVVAQVVYLELRSSWK